MNKAWDPNTLGGERWKGSWGNKIEWGILLSKNEDGMWLTR